MKVGLIYTSTTPELISYIEEEIKKQLGEEVDAISYQDPSILAETRENNYVTSKAAARLVSMYMEAAQSDVDAIINLCSSVGEVADSIQDLAKYIGIPIVRIDEDMCREAVRRGNKIAVMATLPTTLEPTKNTILRVARELGKRVELTDVLVEGAFGLNQETFKELMEKSALNISEDIEVIVFAQGSMAYCEDHIANKLKKTVLSSPRFGIAALKNALMLKGVI
ncbi:hydantoin racemase [Clostridium aceticum]|uniref:Hydantoin racemase n=1 Tax=Clostridium aceticum TaxID=84022 RepID=A0A0D8IB62_9CLOT|nr:aspartate/glutamate racemase family protein [Clostridium aceticum]AKL96510.1 hydantoin racemase [Clostridium aceticum]KJF27319.1 Asp/Glu/hydantoin racemase [Clostridium aceticum]